MSTYAKVITDSISPEGKRLTTIEAEVHRYILAEINTHRAFSRNSASSRAIPVTKMIKRLREEPALPPEYVSEQRGMQAGGPLDEQNVDLIDATLHAHLEECIEVAEALADIGLHKGNANRYLEPFMWHKVVISSTDWKNFLAQRASSASQMAIREFRDFADAIERALDESTPIQLERAYWHAPYIDVETMGWAFARHHDEDYEGPVEDLKRISAARCARVSYLTQDGVRDPMKDLELYDRLVSAIPMHASPLEHVATPCDCAEWVAKHHDGSRTMIVRPNHRGNFRGWDQLRHRVWRDPDDDNDEEFG